MLLSSFKKRETNRQRERGLYYLTLKADVAQLLKQVSLKRPRQFHHLHELSSSCVLHYAEKQSLFEKIRHIAFKYIFTFPKLSSIVAAEIQTSHVWSRRKRTKTAKTALFLFFAPPLPPQRVKEQQKHEIFESDRVHVLHGELSDVSGVTPVVHVLLLHQPTNHPTTPSPSFSWLIMNSPDGKLSYFAKPVAAEQGK